MAGIPLFIAEPTGTSRLALRRFRHRDEIGGHRHDATVVVGENEPVTGRGPDGTVPSRVTGERVPHDDPRWPGRCSCGEPFRDDDRWQVNELDWHEGGGHRFTWGVGSWEIPAGATMRVPWRDLDGRAPAWMIALPNGTNWCTNDRASVPGDSNGLGPYWGVTGTVPAITVSPSIDDRDPARPWHGWIRNGELVEA